MIRFSAFQNLHGSSVSLELEHVTGNQRACPPRNHAATPESSASVYILNENGVGGQTIEGIKIIDIGGESLTNFVLVGEYENDQGEQVVTGGTAYAYTLHKNGISTPDDGDWYLRSTQLLIQLTRLIR